MIIFINNNDKIKNILNISKKEETKNINFQIYNNENNKLGVLVRLSDIENGIKTIKYKDNNQKDVEINANGKKEVTLDYNVEEDGVYKFEMTGQDNKVLTKDLVINDELRKTYSNLNITNIKSYEADGFYSTKNNGIYIGNPPCNAIDNDMTSGNGRNWVGGTKLLIEYNSVSTIDSIGVYTTNSGGFSMNFAILYYAGDDTLTLDSDLSKFKSIIVDTDKIFKLPEVIKAKRIILTKAENDAVYEFKCFGEYQEGDWTPSLNLNYINRKLFECDGYYGSNIPENSLNNSFMNGNGKNWYGGTKLLVDYNTLSTITSIGVYTTDNWGSKMNSATLYYSEDDTLTLNSDLSKFKSLTIEANKKIILPEQIKAKRILLIKNTGDAVYEFQCLGNP